MPAGDARSPGLPPRGQTHQREGRAALGGSAGGETGWAGPTSHPGVRQVREVAGRRRRPGSGSRPRRRHHVSGRGGAAGRALGAERAAAGAAAAACRPRSSRRPQPAPAQRSVLALVPAGASSWTAAAAARGPGGQQSDGTPSRDQGKEGTSCGRGWQRPWARESGAGGGGEDCGAMGEPGEGWRGGVQSRGEWGQGGGGDAGRVEGHLLR